MIDVVRVQDTRAASRHVRQVVLALLLLPAAVFAVCMVVWAAGWRGSDVPAQLFRVELFREEGFTVWNAAWYGGHHTPAYSVLFPPIASLLGAAIAGAAATAAAVTAFDVLTRRMGRAWALGTACFATAMVANFMVGRLPFALGVAFGLLCLDQLVQRHLFLSGAAAVATALSSPVAAVFLALAVTAWALGGLPWDGRRLSSDLRRADWARVTLGAGVAVAAVVPVGLLNLLFPEGGEFPFRTGALILAVGAAVAAAVILPAEARTVRLAAVLFAVVAPLVYLVPNPLGGNLTRFALVAAPALVVAARPRTSHALLLGAPLLVWQLAPAFDAVAQADDPSLHASYHEPLLAAIDELSDGPVRIEIPFTRNHWETVHVAEHTLLARGWERQVDIERNPIFYEGELTAGEYQIWLRHMGVSFVAVADVALDPSAEDEVALIDAGLPSLDLVWSDANWRLYEVRGTPGLLDGPGEVLSVTADEVVIRADEPGRFLLRIHPSDHMVLADRAGCVDEGLGGWTELTVHRPGLVRLVTTVDSDDEPDCWPVG